MEFYDFPYIGNNHPNWRTHIFQRDWNHQPVNNTKFDQFCGFQSTFVPISRSLDLFLVEVGCGSVFGRVWLSFQTYHDVWFSTRRNLYDYLTGFARGTRPLSRDQSAGESLFYVIYIPCLFINQKKSVDLREIGQYWAPQEFHGVLNMTFPPWNS